MNRLVKSAALRPRRLGLLRPRPGDPGPPREAGLPAAHLPGAEGEGREGPPEEQGPGLPRRRPDGGPARPRHRLVAGRRLHGARREGRPREPLRLAARRRRDAEEGRRRGRGPPRGPRGDAVEQLREHERQPLPPGPGEGPGRGARPPDAGAHAAGLRAGPARPRQEERPAGARAAQRRRHVDRRRSRCRYLLFGEKFFASGEHHRREPRRDHARGPPRLPRGPPPPGEPRRRRLREVREEGDGRPPEPDGRRDRRGQGGPPEPEGPRARLRRASRASTSATRTPRRRCSSGPSPACAAPTPTGTRRWS